MKKAILILLAIGITLAAKAQTKSVKPDSAKKMEFTLTETNQMQLMLQKSMEKIHMTHIDALRRDSLDALLGNLYNFINQRASATYQPAAGKSDTTKKVLPPSKPEKKH